MIRFAPLRYWNCTFLLENLFNGGRLKVLRETVFIGNIGDLYREEGIYWERFVLEFTGTVLEKSKRKHAASRPLFVGFTALEIAEMRVSSRKWTRPMLHESVAGRMERCSDQEGE